MPPGAPTRRSRRPSSDAGRRRAGGRQHARHLVEHREHLRARSAVDVGVDQHGLGASAAAAAARPSATVDRPGAPVGSPDGDQPSPVQSRSAAPGVRCRCSVRCRRPARRPPSARPVGRGRAPRRPDRRGLDDVEHRVDAEPAAAGRPPCRQRRRRPPRHPPRPAGPRRRCRGPPGRRRPPRRCPARRPRPRPGRVRRRSAGRGPPARPGPASSGSNCDSHGAPPAASSSRGGGARRDTQPPTRTSTTRAAGRAGPAGRPAGRGGCRSVPAPAGWCRRGPAAGSATLSTGTAASTRSAAPAVRSPPRSLPVAPPRRRPGRRRPGRRGRRPSSTDSGRSAPASRRSASPTADAGTSSPAARSRVKTPSGGACAGRQVGRPVVAAVADPHRGSATSRVGLHRVAGPDRPGHRPDRRGVVGRRDHPAPGDGGDRDQQQADQQPRVGPARGGAAGTPTAESGEESEHRNRHCAAWTGSR